MTRHRKIEIIVVFGIVVILACLLVPAMTVSTVKSRICPQCGARDYQTRWLLGFESDRRLEPGPLTEWLAARGVPHDHNWRYLYSMGRNVFGRGISSACATPPPILSIPPPMLDEFLKSGQEAEVKEFVGVMTAGSKEEQERAIQKHLLGKW